MAQFVPSSGEMRTALLDHREIPNPLTIGQSPSASAFKNLTAAVVRIVPQSVLVQRFLLPVLGHDLPVVACFLAATVSILLSFLRGHAIRRLFNALRENLP